MAKNTYDYTAYPTLAPIGEGDARCYRYRSVSYEELVMRVETLENKLNECYQQDERFRREQIEFELQMAQYNDRMSEFEKRISGYEKRLSEYELRISGMKAGVPSGMSGGEQSIAPKIEKTETGSQQSVSASGKTGNISQQSITPGKEIRKIYPNDPCPCGSGKKYKQCHGKTELADEPGIGTVKTGQEISLGRYKGEDIRWKVLEVKSGKALLLSENVLDVQPYHTSRIAVTWENCSLRKWLNQEFMYGAFPASKRSVIQPVSLSNSGNSAYARSAAGTDATDRIFLLSIEEVQRYLGRMDACVCVPTDYAKRMGLASNAATGGAIWWLRISGSSSNRAPMVYQSGTIGREGYFVDNGQTVGVRPAMWVRM